MQKGPTGIHHGRTEKDGSQSEPGLFKALPDTAPIKLMIATKFAGIKATAPITQVNTAQNISLKQLFFESPRETGPGVTQDGAMT